MDLPLIHPSKLQAASSLFEKLPHRMYRSTLTLNTLFMSKFSPPASGRLTTFGRLSISIRSGLALVFLMILFWSPLANAQTTGKQYDPALYKEKPVWIDMMQDPGVNFFETVKAFREYWTGYELPEEPEEMELNGRFKRDIGLKSDKAIARDTAPERPLPKRTDTNGNDLGYEVKQFKGWFRDSQPWVRKDGHIMTLEERQQLIDRQQQELRAIESNQKRQ